MHDRIYTSILHAQFRNMETPGTYEIKLNEMLTANDLPTVKVMEDPPSLNIIKKKLQQSHKDQRRNKA